MAHSLSNRISDILQVFQLASECRFGCFGREKKEYMTLRSLTYKPRDTEFF